jgi:hypothetical protein
MTDLFLLNLIEEINEGIKQYPNDWRYGQKVFNYLDSVYDYAATKVREHNNIDCFYNNIYVDDFIKAASKYISIEKYKIYQLRIKCNNTAELELIATYEKFGNKDINDNLEIIWHLCNISCWSNISIIDINPIKSDDKSIIIYPIQNIFDGIANSDLIIEYKNEYYSTKPFSWEKSLDLSSAIKSLCNNIQFQNINNKDVLVK